MIRISCLPKTESVVVFDCQNDLCHAGFFHNPTPLVGIGRGGRKNHRIFKTVSPFVSCIRVRTEMNKSDEFPVHIGNLAGSRNDPGRFFDNLFPTVSRFDFDAV